MKRYQRFVPVIIILISMIISASCTTRTYETADLILLNADVYTMEEDQPWATAVVIKGNKIIAVPESDQEARKYSGDETKVIDLQGKFVLPGFIDGHTHFNSASGMLVDANLLAVSDEEGLRKEIGRVVANLGEGEWITGGLWGAYEQWSMGSTGDEGSTGEKWKPTRWMIDDLTPNNPVLLWNYNHSMYLANTLALELSGADKTYPEGMEHIDGKGITGLIYSHSPKLKMVRDVVTPKSHERLMNENRHALKHLRECGIVEIHDIVFPPQTKRYLELEKNGELTCRIWGRPDLFRGKELGEAGFTMGDHPGTGEPDDFLRYGALKGYIDGIMGNHGALFYEPYDDQPDNYGGYRKHTSDDPELKIGNMEKMYRLIKEGYEAGFVSNVHAIGTKGSALMLDTYERLMKDLGRDLEGFRVIHAQVIRPEDFPRYKQLNVIAEVNPYHLSDDMRWMEERIGHERCKGAYAFKSLLDNGATLSFGSDWPGTNAAIYYCHPKYLIHAAVNRTTIGGEPDGGWFPEQKISMHEALKAYTINNAYAAFNADTRGSLKPGKLADITVCDLNLMEIDPANVLDMNIEMTIVDGEIVYSR
ncbi:amidohydrolase [Bacteroidota bacterium]